MNAVEVCTCHSVPREYCPLEHPPTEQQRQLLTGTKEFLPPFEHLNHITEVLAKDRRFIIQRDQEYNASWKARGGVGAFMMLARKWDRLEPMAKEFNYDIFAMLQAHPDRIDDIEDLRRYLALVNAEWLRMNV